MNESVTEELVRLSQAVADLESLVHEQLIALQYEILGTRDGLSEELAMHVDSLKRQIRLHHRD